MSKSEHTNAQQIAFIGGGNMARALIGGLIARGYPAEAIFVAEPVTELRERLNADFRVQTGADASGFAQQCGVWVLAVKPQVMPQVCAALSAFKPDPPPLVLSIAAGIAIRAFEGWFGSDTPVVRSMPNTPALLGAGIAGLYANAACNDAQRAQAAAILDAVGSSVWIPEEAMMDAVTAVSGSGPAYFFLMIEALCEAGQAQGLPSEVAAQLALATAAGAARMAVEGDEDVSVLRQRVTSPGGTTQAALDAFAAGGFKPLVAAAVEAATRRGRELSAQFGSAT